jgi:Cof subfamily protein (haloacid dehalogenase superfamily)
VSAPAIRLVLSDVDGTLVTPEKVLTNKTIAAVEQLKTEGILFAITSGRPPRGLTMLIEPLDLTTPLAAFNGGLIVDRELGTLKELTVHDEIVGPIIEILSAQGLSVWVYQGTHWFVLDLNGPHVAHESDVCQFGPSKLENFDQVCGDIIKVVGVSDYPAVVASATSSLNGKFAHDVSATSSQTYYIDVTHRDANKGSVVDYLARTLSIETSEIATIGDMSNDVLMFARSGMSIAMGNASDEVKGSATNVTKSNKEEGFSHAIEHFLFGASRR